VYTLRLLEPDPASVRSRRGRQIKGDTINGDGRN
jgi:hypothetical protein